MLKRLYSRGAALAAVAIAVAASPAAHAQTPFYQGKTIDLVVGFGVGGGYDLWARALARFWGRHLDGQPNIVVRNMPGAGSFAAAGYIFAQAPKDGTAAAIIARDAALGPLTGAPGARYDASKFAWIGTPSVEHAVCVAIDAAKGEQKWRQNIGSPARSAPTIAEGRLFIITIDDRMVAMAASDGHALWSHRALGAVTSMLGRPAPTYGQGLVIGGFGSGALTALRADSGAVAWTDGLSGSRTRGTIDFLSVRGRPVISNGRVHAISVGGLVAALDLPTGRRLWERQIAGEDSPWVAGDWMFVVSMDQEVAAIDTREGRVAWVTPLPRWADPEKRKDSLTWFGPLLAGDRLVVTGRNEQALSISPYTGEILGRKDLSGAAAPSTPIVADGTLLILTDDARLIALR